MMDSRTSRDLLLLFVACAGSAFSGAARAGDTMLQSFAQARYQGDTPRMDDHLIAFPIFGDGVAALALSDLSGSSFDFARGQGGAYAYVDGSTVVSESRVGGFDPNHGPPNDILATGQGCSTLQWCIASDSLPAGTPIVVQLDIRFRGVLAASNFYGDVDPGVNYGQAEAIVEVDGMTVYAGYARVDALTSTNSGPPVLTRTSDWLAGDFTSVMVPTGGLGDAPGFELDDSASIMVNMTVGQVFEVYMCSFTGASIPGALEAFAIADFLSDPWGGSYTLEGLLETGGPADVQFKLVPVPSTGLLVSFALIGFTARRRR